MKVVFGCSLRVVVAVVVVSYLFANFVVTSAPETKVSTMLIALFACEGSDKSTLLSILTISSGFRFS